MGLGLKGSGFRVKGFKKYDIGCKVQDSESKSLGFRVSLHDRLRVQVLGLKGRPLGIM